MTDTDTSAINLKSLLGSLALVLAAILLSAGAVFAAYHYAGQAERDHRQAQTLQSETRARLSRAHEDEREIRDRIARYQELIRLGRTQPERRLEWVETLGHIKASRRLLGLEYEISPQRPLDEKQPASGGFRFLASPMKLDMPLLHEGDLLGLLDDLAARSEALVSVRSCRIDRLPASRGSPDTANLKASCEIDWITLQEGT
ncbi:MAG: hypothetical protein RBS28_03250 [Rhodocyclaceae bacterium]|jgi:hypothetical protein|nr:hypothetical protein [Rhodocyclaceae bacterium]